MNTEDDLLMLSALQHLLFCERQCALIHIEQLWFENRFTAEGRVMHDRVHSSGRESRGDVQIEFSVPIRSFELGITGQADVVEYRLNDIQDVTFLDENIVMLGKRKPEKCRQPFPVEYKRGKPKKDNCDKVQLCAQAICLEEMTGISVPIGALFYGKNRRRQDIIFDKAIRDETADAAKMLHKLIKSGKTPAPVYAKKCDTCSFFDICMPKTVTLKRSVARYISAMVKE
jgi:CRISPR-associated exonuclease Cas4